MKSSQLQNKPFFKGQWGKDFYRKSFLLRLAAFCVFFGRAWQHIFWDAPYRTFFWDEELLRPLIEGLTQQSWQVYVTDPQVDNFIQTFIISTGLLYLGCALACIFVTRGRRWLSWGIVIGSISLVFLALLVFKEKFYQFGQLLEMSVQCSTPLFLLFYIHYPTKKYFLTMAMKVMTSLTFMGHGLYAIGFYPIPGNFYSMLYSIFHIYEPQAKYILKAAGIFDFLVGIFIFKKSLSKYALYYMALWGFLTAFARIVSETYMFDFLTTLNQSWFHTVYRLPHGIIPLVLILYASEVQSPTETDCH